jgi:hypothetical protein
VGLASLARLRAKLLARTGADKHKGHGKAPGRASRRWATYVSCMDTPAEKRPWWFTGLPLAYFGLVMAVAAFGANVAPGSMGGLRILAGILAAPWSVLCDVQFWFSPTQVGHAWIEAVYIPVCGTLNAYLLHRYLRAQQSKQPAAPQLPAAKPLPTTPSRRAALLVPGAWCLTAAQVGMILFIACGAIDARQTGAWTSIGVGIFVYVISQPVASAGVALGFVLVFHRGHRRLVPGLLLLVVSIVMLSGNAPFIIGYALARAW